ncbi:MAG TPA: phage portal protein [Patescibacteria group bacterium]|nr:phage portal protein [Patescibacteria group bacterium]
MATPSRFLDATGLPMVPTPLAPAMPANRRARGSVDGPAPSVFPYDAANWSTQEMGDWLPWIRSPDAEINQFRDRMVARSRDLARNDGWAAGGITRILDNTVGASFRLSANPDYRALAMHARGFDAVWADEFRRAAEALWRGYADDLNRYNDVSRQLTISQQFRLALRHKLVDGDALAVAYWMPERVGRGGARYATSFLVVDPDRLSNPQQIMDTKYLRGGVEIDDDGVPLAYHIRKAEQNDWYNSMESMEWERVEREDGDGWRRVIHDYERDRGGQHRGVGVFTPVLARLKMLARYYGVELQAATVASIFGTYVTSPYDPAAVQDALAGDDDEIGLYQSLRLDWAKEHPAMLNGVRVPTMAPGETINSVAATHPHTGFGEFAHEMLRTVAAALGVSAEQITQDWSQTNYSSARAALLESWKTMTRRRDEFAMGFTTPIYAAWLHEAMTLGELPLPRNAPAFIEAATAYSRCGWLGPGRGWVDPVKEKQGAVLGMDAGLSTLKAECADNSGRDWEEILDQRKIEMDGFAARGLTPPSWAGMQDATTASTPEEDPKAK